MSALTDWILNYAVGTSVLGDLLYSIVSYLLTGVILEDSVFWTA